MWFNIFSLTDPHKLQEANIKSTRNKKSKFVHSLPVHKDETMLIFKSFTFDSAHALPNVPEGHKCRNVHGHTYHLTAYIEGGLEPHLEWVIDFADIKKIIVPIVKELDHKYLNDLPGLENPTCERIAIWIWDRIKKDMPNLKRIQLNETPTSGVIYEGE